MYIYISDKGCYSVIWQNAERLNAEIKVVICVQYGVLFFVIWRLFCYLAVILLYGG